MGWWDNISDAPVAAPQSQGNWWGMLPDAPVSPTTGGQFLTAGGSAASPRIDMEGSGMAAPLRIGLGMKMTPEGRASYAEHYYGTGNVMTDKTGAEFVRPSANEPFQPISGHGMNFGDVAEEVPKSTVQALPTMLAGSNPLTVGLAAGAGNLARQTISSLMPGDDQMTLGQRAGSAGLDAAMAGGTQGLVTGGQMAADYLRPMNVIRRQVDAAANGPIGQAGQLIEHATQVPMSLGQLTMSRPMLMAEGVARRYPTSAAMMQDFDRAQADAITGRVHQIMGMADQTGWGPEELGNTVSGVFRGALDDALNLRRTAAQRDFGAIPQGNPVIPTDNIRGTIGDLIQQYDVPGGGDATASLVNQLKRIGDAYGGTAGTTATPTRYVDGKVQFGTPAQPGQPPSMLTGDQANRLLQIYGGAAAGTGRIFNDVNSAQERYVARQIQDALGRDLDAAVNSGGAPANVADALRTARDNYRANSGRIDDLEQMTLGRLFNGQVDPTPEAVTAKLQSMQPSQLRTTLDVLGARDPRIVGSLQAQYLQNAMDTATRQTFTAGTQAAVPGAMPGAGSFSSRAFLNALPPPRVIDEVFGRTPGVRDDLVQISRAMERVATREGEGSPTAPLNWMMDTVKNALRLNIPGATEALVGGLGSRGIARAMTTPQGRQSLSTITSNQGMTGQNAGKILHSLAYLYEMHAAEPQGQNVRPPTGE